MDARPLRPATRRPAVEIDVPAIPVSVDPIFLDEALTNVVDNAAKYTPPGARIRISARDGANPGLVRLTVEDAGPGVPREALRHLFEKFYRVAGTSGGSRTGTGIGLAVVRGLVEAMGGTVNARPSGWVASPSTSTCRAPPFPRWPPRAPWREAGAARPARPHRRG